MIDIKDIQGNVIISVPVTQSCQKVEELMGADYIQLSWNGNSNEEIPIGSYIEYSGEKYRLLEPYTPTQKDELEFTYTPQFKSKIMGWGKIPFFFYSDYGDRVSKEPDWALTSNPADFMECVCDALLNETGESWTYTVDASLPASASLSFSSIDVLSALNDIANAFETEWYVDKVNNIIHLEKASYGEAVTLEVGVNIKTPSVNNTREGYYTRFYAFGSTRNITQDYEGANVNNLVNKRLTLDPAKFPNGYKDIREGLTEGEIFSKVLIFDDVYPSSQLSISGVRNRLMYRLDADGNKIQLGTDESGNPIYDQYAIWYFRIEDFDFDISNIIEGYNLSVSFKSGALSGREFELKYHESDSTVSGSDGTTFEVKAGDYEILFVEESNYIIPAMTGIVPSDGDSVILFNIKMPEEYTQSAYDELEAELDKEITRMTSDLNNYSFNSDPVSFNEINPNLTIGRNVTYVNGSYSYNTRVIKLATQLDFPIEQNITIGNEKIKGNTQQLKEEVATANKDLNLLSVFNEMTQSLQQSYARTQQMMLDGFAAIKDIWILKTDSNGNKYAYSKFDIATIGGLTMYHDDGSFDIPSLAEGLPFDGKTIWYNPTTKQIEVLVSGGGSSEGGGVSNFWDLSNIPSWITANKPTYTYSEIDGTPDLSGYQTKITSTNKLAYSLISGTPTSLKNPYALTFGSKTYDGSAARTILASDLGALTAHQTIYKLTFQAGAFAAGSFTANSAAKTINIPTTTSHISEGTNLYFTNARAVSALTSTLANYVKIAGEQTITGKKNFTTGGLFVNGSQIKYDATNKYWKLEGDLLVTGGVTTYGDDSDFTPSTIMDALVVDNTTLKVVDGVLKFVGSVDGGVASSVAWSAITGKPSWITTATPTITISGTSVALGGSITQSALRTALGLGSNAYTSTAYLPLSGGTITASGIPLIINRTGYTVSAIHYQADGTNVGRIGVGTDNNPKFMKDANGTWYNIWHSGNDGSGSGLDADMLDGKHYSDIINGNVASATKLQTARTIWGQSFDGTANITGDLKLGLSRILGVDDAFLITSSADSVTFGYGTSAKGIPTYIDGNVVYIRYGTSRTTGLFVSDAGNVGIGTTSPLYKLDVRGIMMCQYMRFNSYTDESKQIGYIGRGSNAVDDLILHAESGQLRFYANGDTTNPMTFKNQNLTVPGNVYATEFWSNIPSGGSVAKFRIISDESSNATWFQSANYAGTSVNGSIYLSGINGKDLTLCKVYGPLLVTGGVTMYSDRRKKTILNHVELSLKEIADAPLIEHYYNSDEKKTTHVGSIAQYWYGLNDWFCKEDNEGYLTMEIQNAALASAISVARELVKFENETDRRIRLLEEENKRLKEEVEQLKWNIA